MLTHNIDTAIFCPSIYPSVTFYYCTIIALHDLPLTYHHTFFSVVLVFQPLNIFAKFRLGDPLRGR